MQESCKRTDHDHYITIHDINRYRRIVEDVEIRLDDNDGVSLCLWVLRLQQDGAKCVLKDKRDPPPPESGLSQDSFVMCVQTKFQQNRFQALGKGFVSIDATHNTTQYAGLQLFSILVRDQWGHGVLCGVFPYTDAYAHSTTGVPVAWMLSSNGMEATITFFLNFVKTRNPEISPVIVITDCDKAQMNAITAVYPVSVVLLCWWHVLCAIRMHFCTEEFPEVWERICTWIKTSDQILFDQIWQDLQTDALVPQSLVTSLIIFLFSFFYLLLSHVSHYDSPFTFSHESL